MFRKLKTKFILTNLLTSTIVLFVAFSSVYLIAASSTGQRVKVQTPYRAHVEQLQHLFDDNRTTENEPNPDNRTEEEAPDTRAEDFSEDVNEEINSRLSSEREASLHSLLISLLVTGAAMEVVVALISVYLAEQSIKPVRDAYNAQKAFVANASHEIKTPLAVIQANLEAADIQDNQWIDNVQKKVDDLTLLNNQLLALARSDSIKEDIKLEDVNLNQLVDDAVSAFEPKADEQKKSITHSSSVKKDYKIKLNRQALEQILNIYIDNGIKYCKNTVSINIKKDRISVISDGEPMDKKQIPHLFDRFYQSDKTKEGVGLGLAIASSIAEKNDWKLSAKVDEKYHTNIFSVEFKPLH